MKLFFVVGSFKMGGTERTASRIGLEFIKRGHDVRFVLINSVFDYKEPALHANSVVLLKDKSGNKAVQIIRAFFNLVKLLRHEKPDFLISFSLGINFFIFFTFYKRMIFRIESNIFHLKKNVHRRYLQRIIALAPNVKYVVVPSKGLLNSSVNYFFNPSKLICIHNPIDVKQIKELSKADISDVGHLKNEKFIVTAGRLSKSKGFKQLIEVFSKSKLIGFYKLVILGEGPERKLLSHLIEERGLTDHVFLLGFQENPYRFFSKARFFILNSYHESFGNVLIEAMACDTPLISNDCDFGPRDIIKQDINGVLYDRLDEAQFLRTIESGI